MSTVSTYTVVNAGAKVGAYGLVLAAIFAAGAAVGAAVGPIDVGGSGVRTDMDADGPITGHDSGPDHGARP